MKVLLINGSPAENGCTARALAEVASALNAEGVSTEIFHVGAKPISCCIGCGGCRKSGGKCVFGADGVNAAIEIAKECDGIVIGSPVHYASASGAITSFMDRFFYAGGSLMRGKVGAAVASARRAGTTATLDQLNKYFYISGMPIVPSQYWPMVHGNRPEEVEQDLEGMQIMRTLGRNMAWMIKSFAIARDQGVTQPPMEENRCWTNFIR